MNKDYRKVLHVFSGFIAFVVVCYLRNSFFKSSCKYSALVGHNNLGSWSVRDTEIAEGLVVLQALASVIDLKMLSGMKVGEFKPSSHITATAAILPATKLAASLRQLVSIQPQLPQRSRRLVNPMLL